MKLVIPQNNYHQILKVVHNNIFDRDEYEKYNICYRYTRLYLIQEKIIDRNNIEISYDTFYKEIKELIKQGILIGDISTSLHYTDEISINEKYLKFFRVREFANAYFVATEHINIPPSELFYHNFIIP